MDIGGYRIRMEEGFVKTDRSRVFEGIEGAALTGSTPERLGQCSLDIFVDSHLIEVFINDGEYVISNVVYGLGKTVEGRVEHICQGN